MPLIRLLLAHSAALLIATPLAAQTVDDAMKYPSTERGTVVETAFGQQIADPYRWLEADVRVDPKVAAWVEAQSGFTAAYLAKLPERAAFEKRLNALFDFERFGLPVKAGQNLFFRHNSGLQNQSVLYVRKADGSDARRVLIDPNLWAKDGSTALDGWEASHDGTRVAYSVQDGGSDWRTLRVIDVASGTVLPDLIENVKFSHIAWAGNDGIVYSRFPAPKAGEAFQAVSSNQSVWYHKLGTPQSADRQVYATPDNPRLYHSAEVTHDGRWLVIATSTGSEKGNAIGIASFGKGDWKVRPIVAGLADEWTLIDGVGDTLWFVTSKDAARKQVMRVDLSGAEPKFTVVVPQDDAVLDGAKIVGDRLVPTYLRDVKAELRLATLEGKALGPMALPGIGSVSGVIGEPGEPVGHYAFSGFTQPATIYSFDAGNPASGKVWEAPKLTFDPARFETRQVFYPSEDGTKIPMFLVRRKDLTGPLPTILYGYGGFNISVLPGFSPARMAWLEAGGAYAVANIRGGGEYGEEWHLAGKGPTKQNVFDDFIAAGKWLKANGVTSEQGLAVEGGSNGGLLVGAVVNQRPDLFAAAHPAVGVMDMLRFDKFTAGREWVFDYGYPEKKADWGYLRAYSPYHNITLGKNYPAILVTTADTDDRVVPGHSFKYAAALQAAPIGPKPHLIRIETRAGHGAGTPVAKVIAESADVYAFLAHWTGLKPQE
ncbi:prolyl oligopeptidase [Novosphingobium hassiacum]|uniref:prolyl oligopeptidase n=1 Tax=Novosphingobium hassiacum TaxID=173676 RepID=A0A7W5ZVK3_9SPHN|nr:prolyl oligopeptidase family serine peptidase [Novosphingobium hassiacum]MBB3860751.1 prolyl oligopeptidase [Novosphingobium hassiacum]